MLAWLFFVAMVKLLFLSTENRSTFFSDVGIEVEIVVLLAIVSICESVEFFLFQEVNLVLALRDPELKSAPESMGRIRQFISFFYYRIQHNYFL